MTDYVHLDLPDMRLDTLAHVDVNRVVEEQVADHRPDVVYCVQPDVNRDHRVLFDSVAVATRPVPGQSVRRVLTYAPTSSTEWTPAPTELVRAQLVRRRHGDDRGQDRRLRLLRRPRPATGRIRAPSGRCAPHAAFFGASMGCEAAEPFVLVRSIES